MNKTIKVILVIGLFASLTINITSLGLLKKQSDRMDSISNRTNELYNRTINAKNNENKVESVETNEIMTPTELAEYLNIDIKEIYRLVIDNPDSDIPFLKVNGEVRFNKNAIDEYMSNGVKILE